MELSMDDVKGHELVKEILALAVKYKKNVLMRGPVGSGMTMLARRMTTLMPEMTEEEIEETTRIYEAAFCKELPHELITNRPFRAPHHTISTVGLTGSSGTGWKSGRPGEITLAHNGVLFIDEIAEHPRRNLEALFHALAEREVRFSNGDSFPSKPLVIAATYHCPCGWLGHPNMRCTCGLDSIRLYAKRHSAMFNKIFQLQVDVDPQELA